MQGKLIVIEGTDCSGKETQSKLLLEKLKKDGEKVVCLYFPMYDTPSGAIIGASLLGKPYLCDKYLKENHSFFPEGGGNIDSLAALCYYAADRRYNLPTLEKYLNDGYIVIADRYVPSNMAHRGGLLDSKEERLKIYKKIEILEYELMELPRPNQIIFLYMPYDYACILKSRRNEMLDEVERNVEYLKKGERAYLELAELYNYDMVNCVDNLGIRDFEDISSDIYKLVKKRK